MRLILTLAAFGAALVAVELFGAFIIGYRLGTARHPATVWVSEAVWVVNPPAAPAEQPWENQIDWDMPLPGDPPKTPDENHRVTPDPQNRFVPPPPARIRTLRRPGTPPDQPWPGGYAAPALPPRR